MRKRRSWLVAVGLTGFLYVVVTGMVAWHLSLRPHPWHTETLPPRLGLEEVHVDTHDGQHLGAWLWPGPPSSGLVLLLHGHGGNRTGSLSRLQHLSRDGVGVLAISFRGHGDSSGGKLDFDGLRQDVLAAFDYLQQRYPHRSIKVMGTSLGAGAALMAAPDLGTRCAGYLLDAPYQNLDTAVRNRLVIGLPRGFSDLAYVGLSAWAPVFIPGGLHAVDPGAGAAAIPPTTPLVIIAGGADRRARLSEAEAILHQFRGQGKLVVIPGADHNDTISANPNLYWRTVDDWVRN